MSNLKRLSIMERETRSINEILKVLINNWTNKSEPMYDKWGLCYSISRSYEYGTITEDEKLLIKDFIFVNKPTPVLHSDFYVNRGNSGYWWDIDDVKIRLKYLNFLLSLQK